jgi:hypothetical protein
VSLILEALRKLEREKAVGDRGFVVLSHVPWAGGRTGRGGLAWVALLAVLAGVGLIASWLRWSATPSRPLPAAAGPPVTASVVAAPATILAPAVSAPAAPLPSTRSGPEPPDSPSPPKPSAAPPTADPAAPSPAEESAVGATPATSKKGELRLNAISQRDGRPVAILNDRLVREGDSFDGIHVLRIGEAEVEVEVGGERRTLRF